MILLDLDDTLLDHTAASAEAAQWFGERHAQRIPAFDPTEFAEHWNQTLEAAYSRFLRGEISFQEQRRLRIRSIFAAPDMEAAHADALFNDYLERYEAAWRLFPDVLPFLDAHRHRGLAIISDGDQDQQRRKLERTGIAGSFQAVVTADLAGCCKPDARIFQRACELLNIRTNAAAYIGDHPDKDALGACRAGMRGMWLNRRGKPARDGLEMLTSLGQFHLVAGDRRKNVAEPAQNSQADMQEDAVSPVTQAIDAKPAEPGQPIEPILIQEKERDLRRVVW
ncbi:hypothetical protein LBMAG53_03150 [Planctomycetota bacterium]|nr:hypothetical protein LBMAG53_03150 [Planctomycetota bacterium]